MDGFAGERKKLKLETPKATWEEEYLTHQVIPSSTRMLPSKPLLLFDQLIGYGQGVRTVIDLGCGTGRNAIHLARKGCEVSAVDFSETALGELRRAAADAGVGHLVHAYNAALDEPLPFPDHSFDLALDSYVSCHFTDERLKQHYFGEARRVLRPAGLLYSSQFSVEDEYYRPLAGGRLTAPVFVTDPHNGVTKQLYTESEAKAYFSAYFDLRYFAKFEFEDIVLGQPYRRSILTLLLEQRP